MKYKIFLEEKVEKEVTDVARIKEIATQAREESERRLKNIQTAAKG